MATKLSLGKRPKNFKHTVTFTSVDGEAMCIGMTYRYRTKREFGALIDETFGPAVASQVEDAADLFGDDAPKPAAEAAPAVQTASVAEMMDRGTEANADYLLKIAEDWDIGVSFTRDNLIQLGDEQPGAVLAIMAAYRVAVTEGRLGN